MRDAIARDSASVQQRLLKVIARHPAVTLAILFGSLAEGAARFESDLDLAVAGTAPLDRQARIHMVEDLASAFGRPVDLIDLNCLHGPLLHRVLTEGRLILCKDRTQYAELIQRMLAEEADVMPYYRRILAARRNAWIGT
jgi:predicted nucleotidyltransferase